MGKQVMLTYYMPKMTPFSRMLSSLINLGLVIKHPLVLSESMKIKYVHQEG